MSTFIVIVRIIYISALRNISIGADSCLSFYRACGQAAHEVFSGYDIDEESGYGSNNCRRHIHVVLLHPRTGIHEIVQGHRDRLAVASRKTDAEEEVVPDLGRLPYNGNYEDRGGDRQHYTVENRHKSCAVNLRGFDKGIRNGRIVVAKKQRGERQSVYRVDKD